MSAITQRGTTPVTRPATDPLDLAEVEKAQPLGLLEGALDLATRQQLREMRSVRATLVTGIPS